jgi:GDP-L-fucose synthase
MKILLTGKNGLVGSAIYRALRAKDFNVIGVNSKQLNLLDRDKTKKYLQDLKPTVVINAAAKVGGIGANSRFPVEFLSENLQIQGNIIDASFYADVEKFIFLGSSCIYPKNARQPIKESELLSGYLEPTNSAYALAKISGIELIKSYRSEYGKKWISLMPANLYGPGDNFNMDSGHVLPSLINKFSTAQKSGSPKVELWGDGSPLREFLHVDDLAEAVIFCMENYDGDEHLNIGSGEEISIRSLADLIARAARYEGEITWNSNMPNGTPRKILDSSTINNLGWKSRIDLSSGIANTFMWFRSNLDARV